MEHKANVAGGKVESHHAAGTKRLFEEPQGPKRWGTFHTAAGTGNNVPYNTRPTIVDFMAEVLDARS